MFASIAEVKNGWKTTPDQVRSQIPHDTEVRRRVRKSLELVVAAFAGVVLSFPLAFVATPRLRIAKTSISQLRRKDSGCPLNMRFVRPGTFPVKVVLVDP